MVISYKYCIHCMMFFPCFFTNGFDKFAYVRRLNALLLVLRIAGIRIDARSRKL